MYMHALSLAGWRCWSVIDGTDRNTLYDAIGVLCKGALSTVANIYIIRFCTIITGLMCNNNYCSRLDVQTLDYAEVAQFAVLEYTKKQIWGKIARYIIIG